MIKPKALQKGDTIGIVAPSGPTTKEKIEQGILGLENLGYKVKMGKSCYSHYGYLAGKDNERAEDINKFFEDESVDAIMCLRGGYGAPRILNLLDYEVIKNNPKIFIGYSDITALHIAFNQLCDLVTFHGPMATIEVYKGMDEYTEGYLLRALTNKEPMGLISNPTDVEIKVLVEGQAEGEITGGNLSLIAGTIGTPYEINTIGKLLFIEEIDEEPYKVDRMLTQLALAGKFDDANGVILGDFNNCERKDENSLTLMQVIEDILVPYNIPIIYNLKAGHCEPKVTLPLGVKAKIDTATKELIILEEALS